MPLIQGKSKKSFSKNVETEMEHGKPQKQALAIAYSVKRKNAKKFAKGGKVDISAAEEGKPTADSDQVSASSHMESLSEHKNPAPSRAASDRPSIDSASTPEEMAMLKEFRAHMASGGSVENFRSEKMTTIDDAHSHNNMNMLEGKPTRHEAELRAASSRPVADDSSHGEDMLDQEDPEDTIDLTTGRVKYARGGEVDLMDGQPADEEAEEKHASLTAAIMAKRKKFAKGGEVDLQDNGSEGLNHFDDMNYKTGRNKSYYDDSQLDAQPMDSNEHSDELSDEDEHGKPMISAIRRKMMSKRGM